MDTNEPNPGKSPQDQALEALLAGMREELRKSNSSAVPPTPSTPTPKKNWFIWWHWIAWYVSLKAHRSRVRVNQKWTATKQTVSKKWHGMLKWIVDLFWKIVFLAAFGIPAFTQQFRTWYDAKALATTTKLHTWYSKAGTYVSTWWAGHKTRLGKLHKKKRNTFNKWRKKNSPRLAGFRKKLVQCVFAGVAISLIVVFRTEVLALLSWFTANTGVNLGYLAGVFLGIVVLMVILSVWLKKRKTRREAAKKAKASGATGEKDPPSGTEWNLEKLREMHKTRHPGLFMAYVLGAWYGGMFGLLILSPILPYWDWIWSHKLLFWLTPWFLMLGVPAYFSGSPMVKIIGGLLSWGPIAAAWLFTISSDPFPLFIEGTAQASTTAVHPNFAPKAEEPDPLIAMPGDPNSREDWEKAGRLEVVYPKKFFFRPKGDVVVRINGGKPFNYYKVDPRTGKETAIKFPDDFNVELIEFMTTDGKMVAVDGYTYLPH